MEQYTAHVFDTKHNFGGMTFCISPVRNDKNEVIYMQVGVAICSPTDNFTRKFGRIRAELNLSDLKIAISNVKDFDPNSRIVTISSDNGFMYGFTLTPTELLKCFMGDLENVGYVEESFGFKLSNVKLIDGFNFRSTTMRNCLVRYYMKIAEMQGLRLPTWVLRNY